MDVSPRWYGAAGATLVAAGITARYVAKWRRRRYLRNASGEERGSIGGRYYIGIDLTDPFAKKRRPCDTAVLGPDLDCTFDHWDYRADGGGIVPSRALGRSFIMAVDGPQGLAGLPDATIRESERLVAAPGHTPYEIPQLGSPYAGFIRGSVELFYRLVTHGSRFRLLGLDDVSPGDANLIEVFPGAAWKVIANDRLSAKKSPEGRAVRRALLESLGVTFELTKLPTDDQLDAAMAAWTAFAFSAGKAEALGINPEIDERCNTVREGFVVQPVRSDSVLFQSVAAV